MKKHIVKLAAALVLSCSAANAALVSIAAGDLTGNTTWTSTNEYILEGIVYVKNGTLTINPGTVIRGQPRTDSTTYNPGTLVITKTAKINAVGTATDPIIFTTAVLNNSGLPKDTDGNGYFDRAVLSSGALASGTFLDANPKTAPLAPVAASTYSNGQFGGNTTILAALTGGIVVLGDAPTNVDGKVSLGGGLFAIGKSYVEGLTEATDTVYGGYNPLHNSGKLSYISIRHGGAKLSDANEINGLTLAGVGAGTQVDHIDVYVNFDDGIEVFGGSVNLKYLNINYCEDDGFDVDQGWTGAAQFLFVLQHPTFGDSLVEADGHDQDSKNGSSGGVDFMTDTGLPYQNCVITNGTFVGRGASVSLKDGIRMRAGFGGEVLNNIVIQTAKGVRIDAITGIETAAYGAQIRALADEIKFRSNTLFNNTNNTLTFTANSTTWNSATAGWNNLTSNPNYKATAFSDVSTYVNPVGPQSGLPSAFGTVAALPNNPFFTVTTYRGAFSTSLTTALWTNGWTALNKAGVLVSKGNL